MSGPHPSRGSGSGHPGSGPNSGGGGSNPFDPPPSSSNNAGAATMEHPDLIELERRLHSEVDEDFFQDPKKFRTLHRVIDILGMQLLDSADGGAAASMHRQTSDFDSLHKNNPAYVALKQQQAVVEEAIEHMAVHHCADLNSSVVAVGKVARQFNEAATRVRSLRRQVRDIKDNLGTADDIDGGDAVNPNEAAGDDDDAAAQAAAAAGASDGGGGKSLRELWLKKLECEAVLSLLHKLEKIRRAPTTFDILVSAQSSSAGSGPCRIGSAVTCLSDALQTMFSDDVAQVQALHKIMEQLMTRKQRAEEIIWETLGDVIYLRTGNSVRPGELEQEGGVLASGKRHHYVSGEPAMRRAGRITSGAAAAADGSGNSDDNGDDSDDDSIFSDVGDDDVSVPSAVGGKDGAAAAAAAAATVSVGGRTIPRTILDSEVDLEADELRCLEETPSSELAIPRYADPVLALRILTEALARLGRLEDIERVLGDNVERELRRIAQAEQARTFARLERRRNAGGGRRGLGAAEGGGGMMGQLSESDEAMRDFRVHLANLLVAFGSVVLRLSHLAQIVRHKIMTDPQLIGRYSDPSSAMQSVLVAADNMIQCEVKSFLEACLNESEDDAFMYDGMAEDGRGVSSHERGIFSLGIITDTTNKKDSRSAKTIASRANIMELTSDKFVSNVLFARTNMIPQVRHALTFRRSVATWSAESADLKAELANVTGEDTTSPSYSARTEERAIDYLDSIIQRNLLPMLQEEAVNGTISALEREDAFEPRIDPAMYARAANSKNVQVEMCVACQALYRYTGPLFSALHRLPKGGEMYSPLVAVLEHAVLTFNSRVKQRVGQICRGKKASALLDAKTSFFNDIEIRKSYTQLMQAYFGEDDVDAAGASAALGGGAMPISPSASDSKSKKKEEKSSGSGGGFDPAADYERERTAFEMEVTHLSPLLDFTSKNYGYDLEVCNDDELGRAACLAHSLLKVASLLEARLKTRGGGRDKTVGATRALRGSIKTIREHGVRMAKFCRVDMLIQTVKRMSKICISSTLTAKDAVRLPSCVNDLGEHLTSASDVIREAGGNTIAAYSLSSLEQYIPLFLMQTVRIIAQGKGLKSKAIITLNGVEALDRSGSVLYRDLKGATSFENSFWDDELAAESFERSASFIAMIELDMEELISYCRNNRGEFSDEDYKLMFGMDGPRRTGDIRKYTDN